MSKDYKNIVLDDHVSVGKERREDLAKEALKDCTPLPQTLTYEDIDREFKRWVNEDLTISYEGERLKTMVLLSNQRFSEYMQSWDSVDQKHNRLLNFKAVSRETNPQLGDIVGKTRNIPGERLYTISKTLMQDESGRDYYLIYKMKQPFSIDLKYKVSIVTNRIELLNKFNEIVNEKFKSIDCYIRPNGHFIPMKLESISDDSEFSIDDRQFYSQSFNITVMAYIINEDSYKVVEAPVLRLLGIDFDLHSEGTCDVEAEDTDTGTKITCTFIKNGEEKRKFTSDCDMNITSIDIDNISSFSLYINDLERKLVIGKMNAGDEYSSAYDKITYDKYGINKEGIFDGITINEGDEIKIAKVVVGKESSQGKIIFNS